MSKRIRLTDLMEAGIIKSPFKLYGKFKGKEFTATIDKDGFVLMNGKRHTSLSLAAGTIKAEIAGKPANGFTYRRANGWNFWRFKARDGCLKPVDKLRKVYAEL